MGGEGEPSVSAVEEVTINIRTTNGSRFSVKANLESTVVEFKGLLAQNCDVPAAQQRLIYKGRILKDDQTLVSFGLQADHTVHMVRGAAPDASPPSAAPPSTVNNSTPAVPQGGMPNIGAAGGAASLFPGLGGLGGSGAAGLFGAGFPEFEQMQQQLTQNPNMMRDLMNNPAIQGLMNNPEIMRSMIMNNPQIRDVIERNPELGHILNDPAILRQTLEASRNPELMREMMRNTDRAMSNIESSPEGFNMLRRMYENVQEPFLNATTMGGGTGTNDAGSNPFAALLGNQGGAQARDATAAPEVTSGTAAPNANPLPNPWGTPANNAPTTNTTGNARLPSIAGLGGLGLPDMAMPDPAVINQMMQNPALSQMMQSLFSNPQYMEQIMGLNPQLRAMLDTNPQLREMMQNPELLRQLTSPESMQQMMALQQQLSGFGRPQTATDGTQAAQAGGMGLDSLMNMFGGLGAGGLNAPTSNVPPEELYATQLSQLQEMGFFDTQENIRALRATSGNVHAAVERLLGNFGQ